MEKSSYLFYYFLYPLNFPKSTVCKSFISLTNHWSWLTIIIAPLKLFRLSAMIGR